MNRRIMMITGGVLVVMFGLWYVFGFRSQSNDLDAARAGEEVARTTNEQLALRISQLKVARKGMPRLTATLERLRRAVPEDPNLAEFILQANEIAEESGVDWLNIAPTPPAVSETPALPAKIGLNITIDGGYFQVLDYLNRLSELPRIVIIDALSFTPGEAEASGAPRMSAVLTGRMFSTKAGVAAAEAAGTVGAGGPEATTTTVPGAPTTTQAGATTVPVSTGGG